VGLTETRWELQLFRVERRIYRITKAVEVLHGKTANYDRYAYLGMAKQAAQELLEELDRLYRRA